jgi:hypothetical protein
MGGGLQLKTPKKKRTPQILALYAPPWRASDRTSIRAFKPDLTQELFQARLLVGVLSSRLKRDLPLADLCMLSSALCRAIGLIKSLVSFDNGIDPSSNDELQEILDIFHDETKDFFIDGYPP